jgi:hypothetical protein
MCRHSQAVSVKGEARPMREEADVSMKVMRGGEASAEEERCDAVHANLKTPMDHPWMGLLVWVFLPVTNVVCMHTYMHACIHTLLVCFSVYVSVPQRVCVSCAHGLLPLAISVCMCTYV